MVFLSTMLAAFMSRTFYETGMIYAFIIGIAAEIIYLSYSYKLMKKSEMTIREKYTAIIEKYKEREILYEQQKAQHEKSLNLLKKKNEEKDNLLEYEKKKAALKQIEAPAKKKKDRNVF